MAEAPAKAGRKRGARDEAADDAADDRPPLPPAKSIFKVSESQPDDGRPATCRARNGELLGIQTPSFSLLTSRGMPLQLRPKAVEDQPKAKLFYQLPVGDILLRQEAVGQSPDASSGCRGFWPHLREHLTYCSFRNPRIDNSVYGGDAVCSVETAGGRRKVGPRELLDLQKVMRTDIVAAPGEEVPMDTAGTRRTHRAVSRAGDWLKEILEAKATESGLDFDWHVLASIQGGGDIKLRQKACTSAAALPVAGYWVGGLGYKEDLPSRAKVLEAVAASLPAEQPRFLPLNVGNPIEVLQAVLLGFDVLEVTYPTQAAAQGIALTFSLEMPEDYSASGSEVASLLPPTEEGQHPPPPPGAVRQLNLRSEEMREDFGPISEDSPVRQYNRAYLRHLLEVRELLGTMLLAQHNLEAYERFCTALHCHIQKGSIRRFASWFLATQTCEPPVAVAPAPGPAQKRRKT